MANLVKDIMTSGKLITVKPSDPLMEAANTLIEKSITGLPVVDKNGVLVGLLTEYDLIIKGSYIHFPTFAKLLENMQIYKKDSALVSKDLEKLLSLKVSDVMNTEPFSISPLSPIDEAIWVFKENHKINPIPVVDENKKLVGILSRFDVIKLFKSSSLDFSSKTPDKADVQQNVKNFLNDFEGNFVAVSKTRTQYWLVASIGFAIIGFIIAFLLILRVTF